jgi:hypothetical protein
MSGSGTRLTVPMLLLVWPVSFPAGTSVAVEQESGPLVKQGEPAQIDPTRRPLDNRPTVQVVQSSAMTGQ